MTELTCTIRTAGLLELWTLTARENESVWWQGDIEMMLNVPNLYSYQYNDEKSFVSDIYKLNNTS